METGPIGIFDSGYGGLTVLKEIQRILPQYDYIYLGDNARSPYGTRSFEVVYQYTLQAVEKLFAMGCPLVILACNTASAKALRNIQQKDLPNMVDPSKRVLGVIRPSTEVVGQYSETGHVGIFGTNGTVRSNSYPIEIAKFWPDMAVTQEACPMWVPLVENNAFDTEGGHFFIRHHVDHILDRDDQIDTLVLGCTHYPLLKDNIEEHLDGRAITVLSQGEIVAESLTNYLERHPEMDQRISKGEETTYFTTENPEIFAEKAALFMKFPIEALHLDL